MATVYQIVTDRVIEQLEQGTAPWRRPWGGEFRFPRNLASGKQYRGVNVFLLSCFGYSSPYWLTYKQATKLGGHVRKGEKGCPIIFWKEWQTRDKQTGEDVKLPVLRYFTGFHVSQCEMPEGSVPTLDEPANEFTPIERCQHVVTRYELKPSIRHDFGKAFYRSHDDLVGMPKPEAFDNPESYYSTLFHELTHSTGHAERLNRIDRTAKSLRVLEKGRIGTVVPASFTDAHLSMPLRTDCARGLAPEMNVTVRILS